MCSCHDSGDFLGCKIAPMSNQPGPLPKISFWSFWSFDSSIGACPEIPAAQALVETPLGRSGPWPRPGQIQRGLKEIMMTKSQPEKRTKKGQSFRTTNAVVLNLIPAKFIKIGKLQWPLIKRKFLAASRWHSGEAPGPLAKKRRDIAKAGSVHRLLAGNGSTLETKQFPCQPCMSACYKVDLHDCYN